MPLDPLNQLAEQIAERQRAQETTDRNLNPDDPNAQVFLNLSANILVQRTITANKLVYLTDSFIIDHPVYGDIDSAVLEIDGGYDTGDPEHNTIIFQD